MPQNEQPESMKALFYPRYDQLEIRWEPVPDCADNEVILKVAACGICGSELETFRTRSSRRTPPLIMGHEFCGRITSVGKDIKNWKPGDRVVSNSIISCGKCAACLSGTTNLCTDRKVFGMHRNGAFASYINVPADCLISISGAVDPREACLCEPLANGLHLVRLTDHLPLRNVFIIGAGPIGLMAQQAFQVKRNANTIVADIRDERLAVAKALGALHVVNPAKCDVDAALSEIAGEEGLDLVVDAVGSADTNIQGFNMLRRGGALAIIGLYQNTNSFGSYDIVLGEKQVLGSYAALRKDMEDALELIMSRQVDVGSWVEYFSLDEGVEAFQNMKEAKNGHIKSVLVMNEDDW